MVMIRAILFDFDGVVAKSEELHRQTFLEILGPMGIHVSRERWYREFAGTGSRHIITVLLKEAGSGACVDEYVETRKKLYAAHVGRGELKPVPGIKKFLLLARKRGLKTAVVSGGHRSNVELAIRVLGLENLFDIVIGGEDVKGRKPDPECYLMAASMLGVEPRECIGVEDSPAGSEAVRRSGMRLVVVRSPAAKDLKGYDAIIDSFSEFPLELIA